MIPRKRFGNKLTSATFRSQRGHPWIRILTGSGDRGFHENNSEDKWTSKSKRELESGAERPQPDSLRNAEISANWKIRRVRAWTVRDYGVNYGPGEISRVVVRSVVIADVGCGRRIFRWNFVHSCDNEWVANAAFRAPWATINDSINRPLWQYILRRIITYYITSQW